ncbi:hypothetical protein GDO81_018498 [Engystomops pustulosus]|uniref:Uncharacterized protein n=1 Tax=Engystomops pustulosus TaxID=76066 RepID=A0AAV6ZJ83_ENGPU|nr:hypothetical protein GDO81_018498 [Engystomops pustulosus]
MTSLSRDTNNFIIRMRGEKGEDIMFFFKTFTGCDPAGCSCIVARQYFTNGEQHCPKMPPLASCSSAAS